MSNVGGRDNSNQGIVFAHAQAARDRDSRGPTRSSRSCGRELAKIPGIRVFLQNPPPIRIGGSLTKSQYQFTLQGADTDELYECAPMLEEKMRGAAGLPGRDDGPAAQEPAGHASRSTATAPRRSASRPRGSRTRSTRPTARARSRRSTRPTTTTRSSWRSRPSTSSIPRRSPRSTSAPSAGALVPLAALATFTQDVGPLVGRATSGSCPRSRSRSTCARASRSARPSTQVETRRARDAAGRRSRRASRAPRRRSRTRRAASASCSSSRSSSSTWCSASSTRASSTR